MLDRSGDVRCVAGHRESLDAAAATMAELAKQFYHLSRFREPVSALLSQCEYAYRAD
jgi:hypothetical protein